MLPLNFYVNAVSGGKIVYQQAKSNFFGPRDLMFQKIIDFYITQRFPNNLIAHFDPGDGGSRHPKHFVNTFKITGCQNP
jgi:hypothetical protein